jgi:hypothetical protein
MALKPAYSKTTEDADAGLGAGLTLVSFIAYNSTAYPEGSGDIDSAFNAYIAANIGVQWVNGVLTLNTPGTYYIRAIAKAQLDGTVSPGNPHPYFIIQVASISPLISVGGLTMPLNYREDDGVASFGYAAQQVVAQALAPNGIRLTLQYQVLEPDDTYIDFSVEVYRIDA